MSSITSEENKSSSMTSESEQQLLRKKIKEFKYPKIPKRNRELRENNQTNLTISSNLFELKFRYDNYKFTLFSINILPEVSDDNYPLMRIIYSKIEYFSDSIGSLQYALLRSSNNMFMVIPSPIICDTSNSMYLDVGVSKSLIWKRSSSLV